MPPPMAAPVLALSRWAECAEASMVWKREKGLAERQVFVPLWAA